MATIVSRTLSVHQEHELLLKLETAGLTDKLAQGVIDSKGNDLAAKVVRLIQNESFEPTMSQKRAREITGRNIFGVEEAIRHFWINPSEQQLAALSGVPFTEGVLEECKSTHVLVAVFPISILDIRGKVERKLFRSRPTDEWYSRQTFAKDRGEVGWHLVRKTPVANSTLRMWGAQQTLLGKNDETPKSRIVVYTIIGHFLATGERLFENIYVRCSDVDSDCSYHVCVGGSGSDGLIVDDWGSGPQSNLGVASVRKPD